MYLNLLNEKLEHIGPNIKLFLLKFLLLYGERKEWCVTVKELVKQFGMNDRRIKVALDCLCENGFLARERVLNGRPGRPRQLLLPGDFLLQFRERFSNFDSEYCHAPLIVSLLCAKQTEESLDDVQTNIAQRINQKALTNVRRLMLGVLLLNADQCGVVRDLGVGRLGSLVGLSTEQSRWHLKKLKEDGYLDGWVPGTTLKGAKGRLKSIFIVSLFPPGESEQQKRVPQDAKSETLEFFARAVHLAYGLKAVYRGEYGIARFANAYESHYSHWEQIYGIERDEFKGVIGAVDLLWDIGDTSGEKFERIKALMCECASILLMDSEGDDQVDKRLHKYLRRKIARASGDFRLDVSRAGNNVRNFDVSRARNNARNFLWFSRLVIRLYEEMKIFIEDNSEPRQEHIVSSFLYPGPLNGVRILHWVDLRQVSAEDVSE